KSISPDAEARQSPRDILLIIGNMALQTLACRTAAFYYPQKLTETATFGRIAADTEVPCGSRRKLCRDMSSRGPSDVGFPEDGEGPTHVRIHKRRWLPKRRRAEPPWINIEFSGVGEAGDVKAGDSVPSIGRGLAVGRSCSSGSKSGW